MWFSVLIVSFDVIEPLEDYVFTFVCFQMAPMHVETALEVPEYEINPDELDFTQSREISNVKNVLGFSEYFT